MADTSGFINAISAAGIAPPAQVIADGTLHRFHIDGDKPRTENGWYVLFINADGSLAGSFGCWKRDIQENWSSKAGNTLTHEEKARYRANMEAAKQQRQAEQARIHTECRNACKTLLNPTELAQDDHAYLLKKGAKAYGLKLYKGSLVVPVRDANGTLHGLQFINADGSKRFKTGTNKTGHYHAIGSKPKTVLYLAEGYATGATIHQATGEPVAICFDAGNLKPVAEALRIKYPDIQIVICADNDRQTEGNPGLTKATAAAQAIGGLLAVPEFSDDTPGSDFNDLAAAAGIDEVRRQIEAAAAPEVEPLRSHETGRLAVTRGCDIHPKAIEWLWPGWLAAGKFHVLAGAPGTGKTTIAVKLAAIMTIGGKWPDGSKAQVADVAIWSGEDDPQDTLAPRFIASSLPITRVG